MVTVWIALLKVTFEQNLGIFAEPSSGTLVLMEEALNPIILFGCPGPHAQLSGAPWGPNLGDVNGFLNSYLSSSLDFTEG